MRPADPTAVGAAAADSGSPARATPFGLGPTGRILIGLVLGVVIGWLWPAFGAELRPLADAFLRMIRMVLAPLVFATLVVGIAGTGDLKAVGRIGAKALIYFEVATTFALLLGLGLVNLLRPGAGVQLTGGSVAELQAMAGRQQGAWEIVLHLFPTSVVDAMARNDVLQVVVFGTFFGIGLAAVGAKGQPVADVLEAVAQVMFKVTGYVMWFAPIGVLAAVAATVGSKGLGILLTLGKLVLVMYLGYALFVIFVIGGALLIFRNPIANFARAVREPALIAFTTASSEAALPKALEVMERFGVPASIVGFVLPTGYSFNLDGSTLYLSLAAVFVAQAANIHLSVGQQITMLLTLMLTSKGVAGVPRASLVVLMATLTTFGPTYGIPLEGAAILLGIDQILDMGRTGVNVIGNCVASAVVARWEGVLDDGRAGRRKQAA
jgi:proton glutamate symport protein